MKKTIIKILNHLIKDRNENENKIHQRYILDIMLRAVIILISLGVAIIAYRLLFSNSINYRNGSLSLLLVLGVLVLFIILKLIARHGYSQLVSYTLINLLFLLATYMGYKWGVDLPAEILFYVLTIVISGVLIGSKLAFLNTLLISITLFVVGELQKSKIIETDRSWINTPWGESDIIVTSFILLIIATVLWLFNRELKKSEKELKNERDFLEIKIAEKTKELRISQAKELNQIYRFAEFGKLSGGLFHDLINPLTVLMLNINKVKIDNENKPNFSLIKAEINQAIKSSEKMKNYIISVRKQINFQDQKERFSLNKEIEDSIMILDYKIKNNKAEVIFMADENIYIYGDPIKFNQIITNLLSNALDADCKKPHKEIIIEIIKIDNRIEIKVNDNGQGIEEKIISHIFEPFFTTKQNGDNLGLGLSLIKEIIENSFSGTISVLSTPQNGTTFTIILPL